MFSLDNENLDLEKLAEMTDALEREIASLAGIFPDFREIESHIRNSKKKRVFAITGLEGSGKATLVNSLLANDVVPMGLASRSAFTVRVSNSEKESFRVNLYSSQELREAIKFHFRVLGFQFKIPEELYTKKATKELSRLLQYLKKDSKDFQRLFTSGDPFKSLKMTYNSLVMLDKIITGLSGIHGAVDPRVMSSINKTYSLELQAHQKDRFSNWVSSAGPGALIRSICIQTSFPKTLDKNLELIIFHGNLIKDASLRKSFSHVLDDVEQVFYLLNSESGLAVQDRNFFKFLIENDLKSKISAVYNMDSRHPKPLDDMQSATGLMRTTLVDLIKEDISIHAVNPHKELMEIVNHRKSQEIESVWKEQKSSTALEPLSLEFSQLLEAFAPQASSAEIERDIYLEAAGNAMLTAEVIMDGSEQLSGVSSGRVEEQAFEQSLFQLESDQHSRIKNKMELVLASIFRRRGGIADNASQMMNANLTSTVSKVSMPEKLQSIGSSGFIFDMAMESVHGEWLQLCGKLKSKVYHDAVTEFREEFEASLRSTFSILEKFDSSLNQHNDKEAFIENTISLMKQRLDLRLMSVKQPEVLVPLVVSLESRQRIISDFYRRSIGRKVVRMFSNKYGNTPQERVWNETRYIAFQENAQRIDKLYFAAFQAILRNYFLYISQKTMEEFRSILIEEARYQYSNVWRRESAKVLKLDKEDRKTMHEYMNKIKAS